MDPVAFNDFLARKIEEALPFRFARVSALGDDGSTVNLAFGSGIIESVPCSSGYPVRAIDDNVWVIRAPAGNWEVLCKSSVIGSPQYATMDDLEDAADRLSVDLNNKITDLATDVTEVTFGSGAPGAGWTQATETYFLDAGGGKKRMYLRNVAPPPTTSKPPPPPTQTAPKSITINPIARGSWRPNGQTDSDVWQSDWSGNYGNWVGAWFYGNAIAEACAGKSVRDMRLKLSRTKSGGWSYGVQSRIGLHDRATKGNPPQTIDSKYGPKLEWGEATWWTLPESFENSLQSSATKGFFVEGSGRGQYIHYADSAGQLVIRFNP